jgi:hypothetical protein
LWSTRGRFKSKIKYLVAVMALLGVGALGTTLASNISLNSGGPVEFGQGVVQATACDNQISITPYSEFVNQVGAGSHFLTSLKISGIDSTLNKCSGKRFVIKAYGQSGILDLVNYEDSAYSIDRDYNSIEISNNEGVFTWISGGSDGDDIENDANVDDPDRDLTNTSFTINLTSNLNTITRTPLAEAQFVRTITVETYDQNLLSNRILTSSQVGFLVESDILAEGFDATDALAGGNFSGTCPDIDCAGYFTVNDWIANITQGDLDSINNEIGSSGLTRSEFSNSISIKLLYDSGQPIETRWTLELLFAGEFIERAEGMVFGFDGNTGYFIPDSADSSTVIFFSVDGRLQSNTSIGNLTPYGDQVTRLVPIRNFLDIWSRSDAPYFE